jgi:hypothetical protein
MIRGSSRLGGLSMLANPLMFQWIKRTQQLRKLLIFNDLDGSFRCVDTGFQPVQRV